MPFRDSILAVSPPFLTEEGGVAEAVQYAEGTVMDGVGDWIAQGTMASMPGVGTPEALYLCGRDMNIDRGPTETDDHYVARLQSAVDSHRVRGSPVELLKQLAAWFSPSVATPLRLVSNSAVWHAIDLTTLVVTKTVNGTNWQWDAKASTWWWRGWVIIDATGGPWTRDVWDLVGLWGDGGTWGSDATIAQVQQIRSWVDKWKPAHINAVNIIVTFAADFEVADASPPNPSGTSDLSLWRLGYNAIFWDGV